MTLNQKHMGNSTFEDMSFLDSPLVVDISKDSDPYAFSMPIISRYIDTDWVVFGDWVIGPLMTLGIYIIVLVTIAHYANVRLDYKTLFGLPTESENEFGSFDDVNVILNKIFGIAFFYLVSLKFLFMYPEWIASPILIHAMYMMCLILSLPAMLSLLFGSYIMNYLKGDSNSNSILYSGLFDFATLFGFFKRFAVQFVRFVLITIKMALFYHFVLKAAKGKLLTLQFAARKTINGGFAQTLLDDAYYYVIYFAEFVAELFNIFVVYYAQMGAFIIVLFWLLKSLYSSAWPIVKVL